MKLMSQSAMIMLKKHLLPKQWVSVANNIKNGRQVNNKRYTLLEILKNFALNMAKRLIELFKAMNNIKSDMEVLKKSRAPNNPVKSRNKKCESVLQTIELRYDLESIVRKRTAFHL